MNDPERKRVRFDGAGLRQDLRAASIDAAIALVITLALFVWFHHRVASGSSPTVEVMPFMTDGANTYWMYWLCQAFGWSGLLWAWITVMLGLLRSSRPRPWLRLSPQTVERLHRTTSLTTIALMFAHAFWFFAEEVRANADGLDWTGRIWSAFLNVFVPGVYDSGTGVIAILIGLLAFYLAVPLGLAFYARRWIGAKTWRVLHASIIVVYVLSVWHTLLYGTNVWFDGWFRTTVWLLQLPPAALLLIRIFAPAHRPGKSALDTAGRWIARAAIAATILVTLVVAASGRDGGRTRGAPAHGADADLGVSPLMVWLGLLVFVSTVCFAVVRARLVGTRRPPDGPSDREEAVGASTANLPDDRPTARSR